MLVVALIVRCAVRDPFAVVVFVAAAAPAVVVAPAAVAAVPPPASTSIAVCCATPDNACVSFPRNSGPAIPCAAR